MCFVWPYGVQGPGGGSSRAALNSVSAITSIAPNRINLLMKCAISPLRMPPERKSWSRVVRQEAEMEASSEVMLKGGEVALELESTKVSAGSDEVVVEEEHPEGMHFQYVRSL